MKHPKTVVGALVTLQNFPSYTIVFTENGNGQSLLSFTNHSLQLAAQLTSNNILFDGPMANAANVGERVKLYTPSPWTKGSSYSHLDENTFNGTAHAVMTPELSDHEANHAPGNVTLSMFADMGWMVNWPGSEPTLTRVDHCGTLSESDTWIANGVVHVVTCDVTIPQGLGP